MKQCWVALQRVRRTDLGDEDPVILRIVGIDSFPVETSVDTNAEWFASLPCQYHFLQTMSRLNKGRMKEAMFARYVPSILTVVDHGARRERPRWSVAEVLAQLPGGWRATRRGCSLSRFDHRYEGSFETRTRSEESERRITNENEMNRSAVH